MNNIEEEFRKVFGDMYLSESETALRIFEYGYKAGQEALRQALEQPEQPRFFYGQDPNVLPAQNEDGHD